MTPNLDHNPVSSSFADQQSPATPQPVLSQNRDPRLNNPASAGAPDQALAATTVSLWPRVFPGL